MKQELCKRFAAYAWEGNNSLACSRNRKEGTDADNNSSVVSVDSVLVP